jgi:hypothetical protein
MQRRRDIPGPFLGKGSIDAFPLIGSRSLIIQQLDHNGGTVFSAWSVLGYYKQGTNSLDSLMVLTPRETGGLTVGRNITLTLT